MADKPGIPPRKSDSPASIKDFVLTDSKDRRPASKKTAARPKAAVISSKDSKPVREKATAKSATAATPKSKANKAQKASKPEVPSSDQNQVWQKESKPEPNKAAVKAAAAVAPMAKPAAKPSRPEVLSADQNQVWEAERSDPPEADLSGASFKSAARAEGSDLPSEVAEHDIDLLVSRQEESSSLRSVILAMICLLILVCLFIGFPDKNQVNVSDQESVRASLKLSALDGIEGENIELDRVEEILDDQVKKDSAAGDAAAGDREDSSSKLIVNNSEKKEQLEGQTAAALVSQQAGAVSGKDQAGQAELGESPESDQAKIAMNKAAGAEGDSETKVVATQVAGGDQQIKTQAGKADKPAKTQVAMRNKQGTVSYSLKQKKKVKAKVSLNTAISSLAGLEIPADQRRQIVSLIGEKSKRYELDPQLVASVVAAESYFDPKAASKDGKLGLMQIDPQRAAVMAVMADIPWEGSEALVDADYNLELALAHLKYLTDLFEGNVEKALLAQNLGTRKLADILGGRAELPQLAKRYIENITRYCDKFGCSSRPDSIFTKRLAGSLPEREVY